MINWDIEKGDKYLRGLEDNWEFRIYKKENNYKLQICWVYGEEIVDYFSKVYYFPLNTNVETLKKKALELKRLGIKQFVSKYV